MTVESYVQDFLMIIIHILPFFSSLKDMATYKWPLRSRGAFLCGSKEINVQQCREAINQCYCL